MDDTEQQHMQDSSDVEIIDLPRQDDSAEGRAAFAHDIAHRPPFLPRRRRLQIALTVALFVIVLLVVLGSTFPIRNLAARMFTVPTTIPTATLVPGVDLFYINGGPSWGVASLDGKPIKHLPIIGLDPPLQFKRGQHVLQWRAEPFQLQHCIITVPPELDTDSCYFNDSARTPSGVSAWIITFQVSLNTLAAPLRTALLQASQAALDARQSSEAVRPGELYNRPTQQQIFATAEQELHATLHFKLDTGPASKLVCRINGQNNGQGCFMMRQDCRLFCSDPSVSNAPSSAIVEWDVLVPIYAVWDYATLDGRSVAQNQPDDAEGAIDDAFLAPLQIIWNGTQWHVTARLDKASTQAFGNPVCGSAETEVQMDATLQSGVGWNYVPAAVYAVGCVAIALPLTITGSQNGVTPTSRIAAYCLHRFGVLLAANDNAHHLWPRMPVADAYEQRLAQELVAMASLTTQ